MSSDTFEKLNDAQKALYTEARGHFPRGAEVRGARVVSDSRVDIFVPEAYTDNILSLVKNAETSEWVLSNVNSDYGVDEKDPSDYEDRNKLKAATKDWIASRR
eukprot:g6879.t1